jgi:hypothetical protein
MAITYTWKIKSLKKTNGTGLNDVIVGTQWELKGTDEDGDSGVFNGATPFEMSKIDPENFVSYENLTEEMVLDWIKAVVVDHYWDHVEMQILRQIALLKNPEVEVNSAGLPWAPPAPIPTPEPAPAPSSAGE